ncbi:MAG: hypothetical protein ABF772_02860 [Acetobacter orientalis]|uniref:hypothetical protein n=1 Tax=Acetobacter orientalis TaxID=146474 RepID=UPI0039EABDAF
MIIQTKAIKVSSGADKTANHIFYGDKNEHIDVLEGSHFQMKDAMRQAKNNSLKYGFHHFKISSKEKLTNEQLRETINKLAQEYKFNPDDITLIEHTKKRADTTASDKHYHLIVPHYQPTQRKALDTKNSFARNEKIARICEIAFGHEIVQGQHNKAVYHQLIDEGKTAYAERVKPLIALERTHQAHTVNQQRTAEKKGINLPKEKQAIKTLWQACDGLRAFQAGLSEAGYTLKPGDKANTYIIEKNGVLIGSANRLIGIKKELFSQKYKELENEQSNFRNQTGHIEHNRNASRDRRPISVGANSGTLGNDTDTAKPDNHNTIASLENSQQNRKRYAKHEEIKINQILKNIKIYDDSYVKIIDDNYINNLKEVLKKQRKEDYRKIRNAYRNIEYQKYYYKSSNRTYDTNILNIMYNCFSRLFKFSKIGNKKTDIIKPNVKPPLPFDTWKKLTHEQKNTLRFSCMYHYQRTFENMIEFEKLHGITNNNTFQDFLHTLKNKGDFMAEEIINLYPYQYIKELDNQFLKSELYKIMRNKNFCRYTKDDIKENIVLVCENLLTDKEIKEKNAETFRIKESINRMKSMLTSNTTKENKTYNYK